LRFRNVLIAGLVAGTGGAYFTVGAVGPFSKEMTAGAGFIALACLIFGKWTPRGAITAALFFGFANNLQNNLSIIGVPDSIRVHVDGSICGNHYCGFRPSWSGSCSSGRWNSVLTWK
jgi:ABC-type uncharacterized transport system permease subunit